MSFLFYITVAVLTNLHAGDCRWKENCECPVPGSTEKWHLAYCSYKTGSEDPESDNVKKCLKETSAFGTNHCSQNEYWKKEMCKLFHKGDAVKEERCNKKFFIPKLVGT